MPIDVAGAGDGGPEAFRSYRASPRPYQLYDNPNVDVESSTEWNLDIQLLSEVETSPASFVDLAELNARAN